MEQDIKKRGQRVVRRLSRFSRKAGREGSEHIKENVLTADLVIWDEIGTKEFTQFEHENILNLINARIDAGKSNIYTSNLSVDELRDAVGDRLYSRIILCSNDVPFVGLDKRAIK